MPAHTRDTREHSRDVPEHCLRASELTRVDQERTLDIHGPLGNSRIVIQHGQVRFEHSPCTNQYCVHQGWLKRAGQVAICLPNQVSLELLGAKRAYDSLNY